MSNKMHPVCLTKGRCHMAASQRRHKRVLEDNQRQRREVARLLGLVETESRRVVERDEHIQRLEKMLHDADRQAAADYRQISGLERQLATSQDVVSLLTSAIKGCGMQLRIHEPLGHIGSAANTCNVPTSPASREKAQVASDSESGMTLRRNADGTFDTLYGTKLGPDFVGSAVRAVMDKRSKVK